jgi:hypothetical protein
MGGLVETLPLSKQELDQLLSMMKQAESLFTYNGKWKEASRIGKLHAKLQTNLSRYEEID